MLLSSSKKVLKYAHVIALLALVCISILLLKYFLLAIDIKDNDICSSTSEDPFYFLDSEKRYLIK